MKPGLVRRYAVVFAVPLAVLSSLDAQALQFSETLHAEVPATPTAAFAGDIANAAASEASDEALHEADHPALPLNYSEAQPSTRGASRIARVINAAFSMVGTRYRLGRDSADAVDCSALMQRVFDSVGEDLPRTTKEMLALGEAVGRDEVQPGDLLFYRWQRRQLHVALYIDDNTIIHASPSAGRVVVTELSPGWQHRLVAVRRVS